MLIRIITQRTTTIIKKLLISSNFVLSFRSEYTNKIAFETYLNIIILTIN